MRLPFQLLLSVALLQSLASAQDTDQSCAPGTELIDNGCTPCQPGQFGLGGAAQCQACPDSQYSDEGASECHTVTCDPGSVYNGNGDCQQCYPGQYSTGDACQMCPEGFFSSQGSTGCNECPANTYTNYDFSGCEPCPDGTTSLPGSPDSSRCIATDCPVGTGAYGQFGCFGCDFGTYSPGGRSTCEICSPGSVPNDERSACVECPAGTYSNQNPTCQPCGSNEFASSSRQSSCEACEPGYVGTEDHTSCELIPSAAFNKRDQTLMRVGACPRHTKVCMIGLEKWECVDTFNDLQSCGGCWADGTGVDCTSLDVEEGSNIACVSGKCQIL